MRWGPTALRVALVATLIGAPVAHGVDVPLPTTPTTAQPPQPATPVTPAPVAPATPVTPAAPTTVVLRPGSKGAEVGRLQRALKRRGHAVSIDGVYGKGTVRAVRAAQRRLRMGVTGLADVALLTRLGVKFRTVASTPQTPLAEVPPSAVGDTTGYLKVFPVQGNRYGYSDDFGDPRRQGRHEGCDIVDTSRPNLVAVVDGTITRAQRVERGLGGIYVWLEDAQGNDFYYAHMESIAPGIDVGTRVTAGQVLGVMGDTGDARGTIVHLHFEIRPAGQSPINPYPHLRKVDPKLHKS